MPDDDFSHKAIQSALGLAVIVGMYLFMSTAATAPQVPEPLQLVSLAKSHDIRPR